MKTCGVSAPKQLSRHSLKPLWWLSQLLSRRKRSRTSSAKRSSRVVFPIPGPPSTSCRCGFLWYLHSKERTTLRIQNADKCCKCCDAPRTRSLAVQPLTQRGFWEGLTLYWNGHQGLCPLPVSCPCERQLRPAHRRAEGSGNVLLLLEQGRGRVFVACPQRCFPLPAPAEACMVSLPGTPWLPSYRQNRASPLPHAKADRHKVPGNKTCTRTGLPYAGTKIAHAPKTACWPQT